VQNDTAISDRPAEEVHAHQRSGRAIVAATYAGTRGMPALFSRSLFPALMALDDHEGARWVIQTHPDETVVVPFPEGALDIDTSEDYQRLAAMPGISAGFTRTGHRANSED
jgi:CTP:molybdopterin cytidylyltransferase MocA